MEMGGLTKKQRSVLSYVFEQVRAKGRPPSLQEICERFGFASNRSARDHLAALERKGYLTRGGSHRGFELVWSKVWSLFGIPILGRVPAGTPTLAAAEYEGTIAPDDIYPADAEGTFALRVKGDSMKEAGILPSDLLIVREQPTADDGDIVVAAVEDFEEEVTVKRLTQRGGVLYLEPANPRYEAIELNRGRILGKVIWVIRRVS